MGELLPENYSWSNDRGVTMKKSVQIICCCCCILQTEHTDGPAGWEGLVECLLYYTQHPFSHCWFKKLQVIICCTGENCRPSVRLPSTTGISLSPQLSIYRMKKTILQNRARPCRKHDLPHSITVLFWVWKDIRYMKVFGKLHIALRSLSILKRNRNKVF